MKLTTSVCLVLIATGLAGRVSAQSNDAFANRTTITGLTPVYTGTTTSATKETGEPNHAGYYGGKSIWLTWTAPADSIVTVDTIGSNFDTLLAVYQGSAVNALTLVASDDQSGGNNTSRLVYSTRTGHVVQIAVDGWSGASGNVTLHLTAVPIVAPNAAPSITSQPVNQAATAGATVRFAVDATGSPLPSYVWFKDGTNLLTGATGSTLTLTNVQPGDAGTYTAVASNSVGAASSTAATLSVTTPTAAPVFTTQPSSLVVSLNSTAFLRSEASGAASYQWRKDGVNLPGETAGTLVISRTALAQAGTYTVVATNSLGSTTSTPVIVAVDINPNFGRLINLSILTAISADDPLFKLGTVLGGSGTSGTKPIVVRTVGPSLTSFGVSGAISDPKLNIVAGTASGAPSVSSNDNWAGDATLLTAMAQVGAFPFTNNFTRDAAVAPSLAAGSYVVEVSGVAGATGTVLAELYDATRSSAFSATTPRLINVSVLKQIPAGDILTAGFVIGGVTSKTVLVRAIGPGLVQFGVIGAMSDPQLSLYSDSTKIASNDNWSGDPQLTATGSAVGAFALANAASKDAMLLVTLSPGSYTAQASGVGLSSGVALIEVYEVP